MTTAKQIVGIVCAGVACFVLAHPVQAAPPAVVANHIDRHIDQRLAQEKVPASPLADEAEFLRRVYLDITLIPTHEQAVAFSGRKEPDRRARLIDELLARPHFGDHLANGWYNLIVPRGDLSALVTRPPRARVLQPWLADAFNKNRPWNRLVHDLLTAEGTTLEQPSTIFFLLNADNKGQPLPSNLVRSSFQLFLGVQQMQCAECHDHPSAKWEQTDFWGAAAFFGLVQSELLGSRGMKDGTSLYRVADVSVKRRSSAPPGSLAIPQDALKNVGKVVKAKLPDGAKTVLDPQKPLRAVFADWLASGDNPYFAPASVNRLWGQLLGRGLVNPIDDFSDENPPSHPELLQMLAKELVASGFDTKHIIRCICNSQAYQRTSRALPENEKDQALFSHMALKLLTPEMLLDSLALALENPELYPFQDVRRGNGVPAVFSPRDQFLMHFSTSEAGEDPTHFSHGIAQALRLMNDPRFNGATPLLTRLLEQKQSPEQVIEVLYLATLSRRPTADENRRALDYLQKRPTPRDGFQGVLWSLVNRSEFILNH